MAKTCSKDSGSQSKKTEELIVDISVVLILNWIVL